MPVFRKRKSCDSFQITLNLVFKYTPLAITRLMANLMPVTLAPDLPELCLEIVGAIVLGGRWRSLCTTCGVETCAGELGRESSMLPAGWVDQSNGEMYCRGCWAKCCYPGCSTYLALGDSPRFGSQHMWFCAYCAR